MTAAALLAALRARGLAVAAAGGTLRACPPGGCDYAGPFRVKVVEALCLGRLVSPPPPGPPPEKVAGAHQSGSGV